MGVEHWISVATLVINAIVALIVVVLRGEVKVVHANVNSNFEAMRVELGTAQLKIARLEEIIRDLRKPGG